MGLSPTWTSWFWESVHCRACWCRLWVSDRQSPLDANSWRSGRSRAGLRPGRLVRGVWGPPTLCRGWPASGPGRLRPDPWFLAGGVQRLRRSRAGALDGGGAPPDTERAIPEAEPSQDSSAFCSCPPPSTSHTLPPGQPAGSHPPRPARPATRPS